MKATIKSPSFRDTYSMEMDIDAEWTVQRLKEVLHERVPLDPPPAIQDMRLVCVGRVLQDSDIIKNLRPRISPDDETEDDDPITFHMVLSHKVAYRLTLPTSTLAQNSSSSVATQQVGANASEAVMSAPESTSFDKTTQPNNNSRATKITTAQTSTTPTATVQTVPQTVSALQPFQIVYINNMPYAIPTFLLSPQTYMVPHPTTTTFTASTFTYTPSHMAAPGPVPATPSQPPTQPQNAPQPNPPAANAARAAAPAPVNEEGEGREPQNLFWLLFRLFFIIHIFGQGRSAFGYTLLFVVAGVIWLRQIAINRGWFRNFMQRLPLQARGPQPQRRDQPQGNGQDGQRPEGEPAPDVQPGQQENNRPRQPQRRPSLIWAFVRSLVPEQQANV